MRIPFSRFLVASFFFFSMPAPVYAFPDVPESHQHFAAITYMQERKIVQGYPDGTFRPKMKINRAEFTKILIEAYFPGEARSSDCFKDVTTQWFAAHVCLAKEKGVVVGYADGYFRPENTINLAEAAKIIVRAADIGIREMYSPSLPWYAPFIEALTEKGVIPATFIRADQWVTRAEMAEMIYREKEKITGGSAATYDTFFPSPNQRPHGTYSTYLEYSDQGAPYERVIFFFHASWCPECRAVDADIRAHADAIPYDTQIVKVDYDTVVGLKSQFGVTSQHTFVQTDSGVMVKKWSGGATLSEVLGQVQ